MAYDPADLKLPHWLLRFLDLLVEIRIPLGFGWRLGFTRPGIIFSAALMGVWAAALYSGNNLLYLCGAMIAAMSVAAIAQAMRLLKRFPNPIMLLPLLQQGTVTVLCRKAHLPVAAAAGVAIRCDFGRDSVEMNGRCEGNLLRLDGRIRPHQRGLFECRQMQLSTDAPLGLFKLSLLRRGDGKVVVMPEPVVWHPGMQGGSAHDRQSSAEGDEWLDLRSYLPGDPLSRVHWRKASGDISDWKVKRFAVEREQSHEMLLRADLRLPTGTAADAFEQLLGRVWFWVQEQGGRGTLILGQQRFELGTDEENLQCAIAAAEPETAPAAGEGGMLLAVSDEG